MNSARRVLWVTLAGGVLLAGCASTPTGGPATGAVEEPPAAFSSPAERQAMGPPPGYVPPQNYWVREKIILGEITTIIEREIPPDAEPAPPASATQKGVVKKGKKHQKG
jgi:hypothetical protein